MFDKIKLWCIRFSNSSVFSVLTTMKNTVVQSSFCRDQKSCFCDKNRKDKNVKEKTCGGGFCSFFSFCLLAAFKHPCWSWLVFAWLVYTAVSCDIIISKVRHQHIINSHWNLNTATNLDWSLPKNLYAAIHCGCKVTGRGCWSSRVNETKALRVSVDSRWWKVRRTWRPESLFFHSCWHQIACTKLLCCIAVQCDKWEFWYLCVCLIPKFTSSCLKELPHLSVWLSSSTQ